MTITSLARLAIVLLLSSGCHAGLPQPQVRAESEGALYIYLQPLGTETERLRVTIEGISAVAADGGEIALGKAIRELSGAELTRQRLLAAGPLPAGDYMGFAVRVSAAGLRSTDGQSSLRVPEVSTKSDFRFTVRRGEASVLAFALRYAESIGEGFQFSPVFAVYRPDRPPIGLIGFIANTASNDLTLFNKNTGVVFDAVATGRGPAALALDQRGRRLYVALSGDDAVDVVDIQAGVVLTDRIRLTSGDEPVSLALTPDGATLLVANRASNTVSFVDTAGRFEQAKIPVGAGPRYVFVERAGRRAFVINGISSSVSVLDIASRLVSRTIPTDLAPVQAQLNRRGDRLYVIHELASYVTAINPVTLSIATRQPVRSPMEAIKVDPSTDLVYLAGPREFTVGVYDGLSFAPVDYIDSGPGVVHMAIDPDENTVHLVSRTANRLLIYSRIRKRLLHEVDVGAGPVWVTLMGER